MCPVAFSFAVKPSIKVGDGKFFPYKYTKTTVKAETLTADPKRGERFLPDLTIEGIPHIDHHMHEIVRRQSQTNSISRKDALRRPEFHPMFLEESYERCRIICAEYAKTFYLGTFGNSLTFFLNEFT